MFNIIKTHQNYFTRELLHDSLSSDVALHFSVSHRRPYLVVSCSEEVFCQSSTAPASISRCFSTRDGHVPGKPGNVRELENDHGKWKMSRNIYCFLYCVTVHDVMDTK